MTEIARNLFENHIAWLQKQREKATNQAAKLIYAEKLDTAKYLYEEIEYQEKKASIE